MMAAAGYRVTNMSRCFATTRRTTSSLPLLLVILCSFIALIQAQASGEITLVTYHNNLECNPSATPYNSTSWTSGSVSCHIFNEVVIDGQQFLMSSNITCSMEGVPQGWICDTAHCAEDPSTVSTCFQLNSTTDTGVWGDRYCLVVPHTGFSFAVTCSKAPAAAPETIIPQTIIPQAAPETVPQAPPQIIPEVAPESNSYVPAPTNSSEPVFDAPIPEAIPEDAPVLPPSNSSEPIIATPSVEPNISPNATEPIASPTTPEPSDAGISIVSVKTASLVITTLTALFML